MRSSAATRKTPTPRATVPTSRFSSTVEQNARLALKVSDRAYILERGAITAQGPSRQTSVVDDLVSPLPRQGQPG